MCVYIYIYIYIYIWENPICLVKGRACQTIPFGATARLPIIWRAAVAGAASRAVASKSMVIQELVQWPSASVLEAPAGQPKSALHPDRYN